MTERLFQKQHLDQFAGQDISSLNLLIRYNTEDSKYRKIHILKEVSYEDPDQQLDHDEMWVKVKDEPENQDWYKC